MPSKSKFAYVWPTQSPVVLNLFYIFCRIIKQDYQIYPQDTQ